ncbi:DUF418 domain-containing protein [Streptomyces sp. NPDC059168]|uniref:DUF418 domain-containing protein n=1 Tax=Streptomyces sp. NPDC059168 TaxID=3346753 RepID=UPI003682649B
MSPPFEGDQPPATVKTPAVGRLIGIDLARGLAVLGMFSAHVGPAVAVGGPLGFLLETARGRSAALFAVLAGFSLVIITGRPRPHTGRAGRQAVARIVIRAALLLALGYALIALDTDVDVILSAYGLLFLTVLPLYRLGARTLALISAASALLLPQVLYVIRAAIEAGGWADTVIAHDPVALISNTDGVIELLFTGEYPVLTWIPFLVAGMVVARLDLTPGAGSRLAFAGGALALLGYGGSWLALHVVPNALPTISSAADGGSASSAWWSDAVGTPEDHTPLGWLLVAAPHSQTTFSIIGNTGVALAVIAACLAVAERMPRLTALARPVAAVGMTALTAYVLHIIALWSFSEVWYVPAIAEDETLSALPALLGFIGAAMLLATVWTRLFRRGPLEQVLHVATQTAQRID